MFYNEPYSLAPLAIVHSIYTICIPLLPSDGVIYIITEFFETHSIISFFLHTTPGVSFSFRLGSLNIIYSHFT